mgnify:CR=1 FL=1
MTKIASISVIIAGCMWGAVGIFVRYLSSKGIDNVSIVESRMLGAFLILFLGILIYDKKLLKLQLKDLWILVCAGVFSSLGLNYFYNLAIKEVSLSLAAILLSTMPAFVIIISRILFKEKITRIKLVSMILVFLGCIFVSGIFDIGANLSAKGIFFGLMSGIGYAFLSIFVKIALNKGYNALTVNLYCFLVSSVLFAFFTDWSALGSAISQSKAGMIGFLIIHSLVCAAIPYALYNFALKHIEAGKASILASCEPVAATFFGLIIYKEYPSWIAIIGLIIVVLALVLLSKPIKTNN